MISNVIILILSLVFLGFSAKYLVDSAVKIAHRFKLSEMFIGLTLVALGTSAPELVVSVIAAFQGQGDLSVGNVIGSNIFNLGFILGLVALIASQAIPKKVVKRDGMILLAATVLIFFFAFDLRIVLWEGITLLLLLASYLLYLAYKKDLPTEEEEESVEIAKVKDYFIFLASLAILIIASQYTVSSAVFIAEYFKVSAWAIGATIVAAGTSLPELAVSLTATIKGKFGLSIGNVIGSDIFNTLGVIGISSVISPINLQSKTEILGFPDSVFSIMLLILTLILTLVLMRSNWRLGRKEGALLLTMATIRIFFEIYIGRV